MEEMPFNPIVIQALLGCLVTGGCQKGSGTRWEQRDLVEPSVLQPLLLRASILMEQPVVLPLMKFQTMIILFSGEPI